MKPTSDDRLPLTIRVAEAADAAAVAALHVASWRAHYRGALSGAYLDGPIEAERLAVWTDRLGQPAANQRARLALIGAELVGFACVFLDDDARYGSLIDNLHVAVRHKGRGIGRRLMHAAGLAMHEALPNRPAYLYVLAVNTGAQAFYERVGGVVVQRLRHREPDGSENPVLRFAWPTPAVLVEATAR